MRNYTKRIIKNVEDYSKAVFLSKKEWDNELDAVMDEVQYTKQKLLKNLKSKLSPEQQQLAKHIQKYYYDHSKFIKHNKKDVHEETKVSLAWKVIEDKYDILRHSILLILYTKPQLPWLGIYSIPEIMRITECRPEEEFEIQKIYTDDDIIEHIEEGYEEDCKEEPDDNIEDEIIENKYYDYKIALPMFDITWDIMQEFDIDKDEFTRLCKKRMDVLHKFFIPHPKLFPYRLSYYVEQKVCERYTRRYFPEHYALWKIEKYFDELYGIYEDGEENTY